MERKNLSYSKYCVKIKEGEYIMSRAIEQYICASEDRSHYNTEDIFPYYIFFQILPPPIKPVIPIQKEEVIEEEENNNFDS